MTSTANAIKVASSGYLEHLFELNMNHMPDSSQLFGTNDGEEWVLNIVVSLRHV